MNIPKESEHLEKILNELSELFAVSNGLLRHCVDMVALYPVRRPREQIDNEPVRYRTSHAICIKACKSFRASIALASVGAQDELNVVSRTLFETFVALNFVLQEKLHISKKIGETSAEKRAKMYLAHGVLKRRKKMQELKENANWSSPIPNESVVESNADHAVSEIGEELASRLMSGAKTYSTLSLRDLISRFDEPSYDYWYDFLYSDQSQIVHASDPMSHIAYDQKSSRFLAKWFGSTGGLGMSLGMNGLLLYGCFVKLHDYCSFDLAVLAELNRLGGEVQVQFDQCFQSANQST